MGKLAQGQFYTPRPLGRAWGALEEFPIPEPAATKPWKFTFPPGGIWRLVSLCIHILTSAEVGNRFPTVRVRNAREQILYEQGSATAIVAVSATNISVCVSPGITTTGGVLGQVLNIPEILFPPEWVIEGGDVTEKPGDQFSKGIILLEKFEDNPDHPIADIERDRRAIELLGMAADIASQ